MAVEKFLQFWTAHNTRIIEVLIALILLLSIYIAFRALFGKSEAQSEEGQFDSAQLEKTLQKILENQNKDGGAGASAVAAAMDSVSASLDISDSNEEAKQVAEKMSAEVERYKSQLNEKIKEIESLKTQLAEAQSAAPAGGAAAAPAAASAGGMSSEEKESYEGKIKDLEARLSEYEIIAEDIADLSMYKEENEKLKAEIEMLKAEIEKLKASGGTTVAGPTIALDPALDIPSDLAALMEQPVVVEEEAAPSVAVTEKAPEAEAPVEAAVSAPAATAAADEEAGLISDDLMAEFEAAVAEQKGTPKAADVKLPEESDQLMDEFEKFVKKG